ncbi:MAG: hypothetical protein ACM3KL_07165 [Alphaproteobacteria bacterium]
MLYRQYIAGAGVDAGTALFVFVDQDGKLGAQAFAKTGTLPAIQPQSVPDARQAKLNLKVKKLQATVTEQQKQIETLTVQLKEQAMQIQKVSAQLEMNAPATKVATVR